MSEGLKGIFGRNSDKGDENAADPKFRSQDQTQESAADTAASDPASNVDISALNQQIVQAVQFSNAENLGSTSQLIAVPPDVMAGQAAGLAMQSSAEYMQAIMQIALAAQAVIASEFQHQDVDGAFEEPIDAAQSAGSGVPADAGVDHLVGQAFGFDFLLDQGGKGLV